MDDTGIPFSIELLEWAHFGDFGIREYKQKSEKVVTVPQSV